MKVAGSTWILNFDGIENFSFDGPMSAHLRNSDGLDSIPLSKTSNLWVETDEANYSALRHKSQSMLTSYTGIHFVYGWGLLGLLVGVGLPVLLIRRALNHATNSSIYFPEAKPEDFPGIDSEKLEYYSQFLLTNGFKFLRDFTVASASPSPQRPASFARLFVNPDSKCFAEISQIFTPQRECAGMQCCFLTAFEGEWRFSTSDRVADSLTYIARRPRTLWLSRPGMACEEMLSLHLQMLTQIQMRLGLSVVDDVSIEGHFLRSTQALAELNKIVRRKSFFVLPLIIQYQYHQHRRYYEWLGNTGLNIPAFPWNPPVEQGPNTLSAAITRWSPTLNFVSTVLLAFSAFLMFFGRSHSTASMGFNIAVFSLGLTISAVVALAKHATR
jgi:hypothetical protein